LVGDVDGELDGGQGHLLRGSVDSETCSRVLVL
jgi:hypothetical protein